MVFLITFGIVDQFIVISARDAKEQDSHFSSINIKMENERLRIKTKIEKPF